MVVVKVKHCENVTNLNIPFPDGGWFCQEVGERKMWIASDVQLAHLREKERLAQTRDLSIIS